MARSVQPRPRGAGAEWTVPADLEGFSIDRAVRSLAGMSWSEARAAVSSGKIWLGTQRVTELAVPVRAGDRLALRPNAPSPAKERRAALWGELCVHVDAAVVVVRKPAGVPTIPYGGERPEQPPLDALVREWLAARGEVRGRAALNVVHRLDKATSGLIVFARTFAAKKHLSQQFRLHTVHRRYLAVAAGDVRPSTIRSYLLDDRGDGRRGSARPGERQGRLAVTHVERVEGLRGATLIACRLETGRTHQIRIHLSEQGHPLLGDPVYGRSAGAVPCPRLMLHAAELGFDHPHSGRRILFQEPPPEDFARVVAGLRG